ncbi:MAG: glycogen debranching protein [Candidatus Rokubacteria bacterium 13_1_20CM_4_70_14]|nr:MAG: glycogen debranching protein [Candidatus Rokubacteria bacterium 13_1_20CM_4_70_14]
MLDWGEAIAGDLDTAERLEWLCTNGIGGFASGTVAGSLTRRYHGLLVAALEPPLGRALLVAKVEETAAHDGLVLSLGVNRWEGGAVDPHGYRAIERFRLDGTTPVWTYAVADGRLEKRVWMEPGANTTYVQYRVLRARGPVALRLEVLVDYRDYHGTTRGEGWQMDVAPVLHGLRVSAFEGARPILLLAEGAEARMAHTWHTRFDLPRERQRGLEAVEDHLHAGTFSASLDPGAALTLVLSAEAAPAPDGEQAWRRRAQHEEQVLAAWTHAAPASRALPGLTLATGRPDVARRILTTFARFVDQGMLPNRFPDARGAPEYNTVDATLWYVEAIRAYPAATDDDGALKELWPALEEIVRWHREGTRYGIKEDPADGLLASGEPGVALTWMDAKVDDRAVTPRIGKPVEINALWYNALVAMAGFARRLGKPAGPWEALAARAKAGFARFWNERAGCCFDVIDGPGGNDDALRPNQIFAVSLPASPLPQERQRRVVDACARHLLTSYGLRSLAPGHSQYQGHYGGDQRARDGAYHQGTVWAWLLGPFALAHVKVYRDTEAARSFLAPLADHLADYGVGSIAEIFDGDPPFAPAGCIAQAWSVAETLRAWHDLGPA